MKKLLLLLIATSCGASLWAADMKQCRNCGKWFEGNASIGYDYCRRNSCQSVRHKEESEEFKRGLEADRKYLKAQSNKAKLIKKFGEYLIKAKKEKTAVEIQLNVIAEVYKNYNSPYLWKQVICYSSMDVIKACWPVADNQDIMRKSSAAEADTRPPFIGPQYLDSVITMEKSLHAVDKLPMREKGPGIFSKQSNKRIGCAFALGRHQKTGKTRYVEKLNANSFQYLIWAAEAGRTDVLEWFFKQMGGVDTETLCVLTGSYAAQVKVYDQKRGEFAKAIKDLEKQKDNAADKFQENEIEKKISDTKAKMAKVPTKPNKSYEDVIKTVMKNTDAKVFDDFIAVVGDYFEDLMAMKQYKNIALDVMKHNASGKKAVDFYESLNSFVWKSGVPNVKKVGVLSGTQENTWVAAPGFVMQADGSAKWQAGLKHPKYKNIVSAEKIFNWLPVKDYFWKNSDPKSLETADASAIVGDAVIGVLNKNNRYR